MKCNIKQQESAECEKRGCEGCFYEEKTADEMFEELGYVKDDTGNELIYQLNNHEICFYLNRQSFDCGCGIGREFITMQELQAINKKVQELGWKG